MLINNFYFQNTLLKCYNCFKYYHSKCHGKGDTIKENRFCCNSCGKCPKGNNPPKSILRQTTDSKNTEVYVKRRGRSANRSNSISDEEFDFLGFEPVPEFPEQSIIEHNRTVNNNNNKRPRSISMDNSTQIRTESNNDCLSTDDETNIPDVIKWSTNDVFEYFKIKFPSHAHVFEDEQIDGESLFLLNREDVVRGGLKIQLGPALKIYKEISKLQNLSKNNNDDSGNYGN